MAASTIGGLFADRRRAESARIELQRAKFPSAQISDVDDGDAATTPSKSGYPVTGVFEDHTVTASRFRDSLAAVGMSEDDARYFEAGVARGGTLLTVQADERASEAVAILQRNGAEVRFPGRSALVPAATDSSRTKELITGDQIVQLRAERLEIGKVRVASGEARVRKQVVAEEQSIEVSVVHEELVIERHPITGATAVVDRPIGADKTITIFLSREEVTVGKQTFVTEQVDIGKRAVDDTMHVSETVRHEELVVDTAGLSTMSAPAQR